MFHVLLYFNDIILFVVADIIGCVIESGNLEVYDKESGNEGKRMVLFGRSKVCSCLFVLMIFFCANI